MMQMYIDKQQVMERTGHHKLEGTVARLRKVAGIKGFCTDHFLRSTEATRLYDADVDKQQVMERTGHHNLDGIKICEHILMQQKNALSTLL